VSVKKEQGITLHFISEIGHNGDTQLNMIVVEASLFKKLNCYKFLFDNCFFTCAKIRGGSLNYPVHHSISKNYQADQQNNIMVHFNNFFHQKPILIFLILICSQQRMDQELPGADKGTPFRF
jgi:hypothetical protein